LKLAKSLKKKAHLVQDKLIIDRKPFTVGNLDDIPFDTSGLGTEITGDHVLFSGRFSPFSNFFTREDLFTGDDGITYCSTEQYFQYNKAVQSNCHSEAMNILYESDPVAIKKIGDSCKRSKDWDKVAQDIIEKGVLSFLPTLISLRY
jgi:hypothetical protein